MRGYKDHGIQPTAISLGHGGSESGIIHNDTQQLCCVVVLRCIK